MQFSSFKISTRLARVRATLDIQLSDVTQQLIFYKAIMQIQLKIKDLKILYIVKPVEASPRFPI